MDFKNPDFLYATVDIAIWSDIEQGLAITAGSLATLRPLYRKLASRFGFSTGDSSAPSDNKHAAKWSPNLSSPRKKGFTNFESLFRSEKGTVKAPDEEYGMGDLQPIRLRDDLDNEKNERGFNSWEIESGRASNEAVNQAGTITMQKQFYHSSEQRV